MTDTSPRRPLRATVVSLVVAGLLLVGHELGLVDFVDSSAATEAPAQERTGPRLPGERATGISAPVQRPATAPSFDPREGRAQVAAAFREGRSDLIVGVEGEVVHLLPDDEEGSRHQLFLLELEGGQTLKVSHNIDLAPRIPLEKGDRVRVRGEYEWNDRGGVVHWTHLTSGSSDHPHGYVEHEGTIYQ